MKLVKKRYQTDEFFLFKFIKIRKGVVSLRYKIIFKAVGKDKFTTKPLQTKIN